VSVGAGVERGGLARGIQRLVVLAAGADLVGLALLERADELAGRAADEAARDVALQARGVRSSRR
jgi:hypothetical protein